MSPRRRRPHGEYARLDAILADRDFLEYTYPLMQPPEELIAAAMFAETGAAADQRRAWVVMFAGRLLAERVRARERIASLLAEIDRDHLPAPESAVLGEQSFFTRVVLWALQPDYPDLQGHELSLSRAERTKLERAARFAVFGEMVDSALENLKAGDFHRAAAMVSRLLSADNFAEAVGGRPRTLARRMIERKAKELLKNDPSLSDRALARQMAPSDVTQETYRKIVAEGRRTGRIPGAPRK